MKFESRWWIDEADTVRWVIGYQKVHLAFSNLKKNNNYFIVLLPLIKETFTMSNLTVYIFMKNSFWQFN